MGTLEDAGAPLKPHLSHPIKHTELRRGSDMRGPAASPYLRGQLTQLIVYGSPRFFAGWDPNPSRVLQDGGGEAEHQSQLPSSHLQELYTDDAAGGFLAAPICSLLSSSLTKLSLDWMQEMERFSKEQEDALHLLASLQELHFSSCRKLQHLPAGLHKLTNLKRLIVYKCPAVLSLPKDGLPKSLEELDVRYCDNEELRQLYRGLAGTIPRIRLTFRD